MTTLNKVLPYLRSKSTLTKEEIKQQFPDLESGEVDTAFWIWQHANANKAVGRLGLGILSAAKMPVDHPVALRWLRGC